MGLPEGVQEQGRRGAEHAQPEPVRVDRRDVADAVGREGVRRARRPDHSGETAGDPSPRLCAAPRSAHPVPLADTPTFAFPAHSDHPLSPHQQLTRFFSRSLASRSFSLPKVIAEGDEEPNDTFLEQLVDGAKAAIDECVKKGVVDPKKCSVGGHSYGEGPNQRVREGRRSSASGEAQGGLRTCRRVSLLLTCRFQLL